MSAAVTVRRVRPEEYEAAGELTLAAYRHLLGPEIDAGYAAELADVAGRAELVEVLVAVDNEGRLLGSITYVPGPGPLAWFDRADEAGLRMLAVAPTAQGRGVGAALVATSLDRARAAGKARVFLHTTAAMTTAHRLYARAGFVRDTEHDEMLEGGLALLGYVVDLSGRVGGSRPGGGIG